MIRSKIVFHPYFQHLWVRPNFCIPYRWHFLFHSREHVLPIPTWWNPIKWRLVWFVINRKWCKMEVINSNFEQRLLNLHDIIHWSFINFYCEFRKAPSKKLPNHFFSMLSFFTEYSFAPFFFPCFTDPSCRVSQQSSKKQGDFWGLKLPKGVRKISNR